MIEGEKTSIDLITVKLSDEKLNQIRSYNNELNQIMNQIGRAHIRRNELHEELQQLDELIIREEENFKSTNSEMRNELNELDKVYPKGQIDLDRGTVTYNMKLNNQFEKSDEVNG
jgi:predicted  nucleic acid-binding Zn-ribbon protein